MTEHAQSGIAQRFTNFGLTLSYGQLSAAVIAEAKKAILDTLGVALIGSADTSTRMLRKVFDDSRANGTATVWGANMKTTATVAALVNGYAAQALDYDDTQHNCVTHMSAPVLAAALVVAEMFQRSGKDLLTAYIAGFEIGCRLGRVARFGRHLSQQGFHATGVLGHFGAAMAAGRLMELDAVQMNRGFGIAASQTAGLMRAFGTMCKPLHAGNAAQDAVLSTLLAKQGFTAPEDIFMGEHNIFAALEGRTDSEELFLDLGQRYEILHNTIKPYACAGWRNPIVEAMIYLATTYDLRPGDVERVQLWAYTEMMQLPDYSDPTTGLESKFSAKHAAAVAVADRAGGVAQFTDERVRDPLLVELRKKITIEVDKSLERHQIRVLLNTADGRELAHFVPAQKGGPRNPLSWDELMVKFRANAITVLPKDRSDKLTRMLQNLEQIEDISELTQLCRAKEVAQ